MKVIIEKVNTNSVEIIGKTFDSVTYSGDKNSRNLIKGQTFITLDDVEDNMTVRGEGKDTLIRKVEKLEKAEIKVQLLNAENLNDGASLATAILKNVYIAKGKENDMKEIFVMAGTNDAALNEIKNMALLLGETDTGARAMGKWYPSLNGSRVIIRLCKKINNKGKIVESGCNLDCTHCANYLDCGNAAD